MKIISIFMALFFSSSVFSTVLINSNNHNKIFTSDVKDIESTPEELIYKYCIDKKFSNLHFEPKIIFQDTWDFRTQAEHEYHKFFVVRNFWEIFKVTYIDSFSDEDMDTVSSKAVEVECIL